MNARAQVAAFVTVVTVSAAPAAFGPSLSVPEEAVPPRVRLTVDLALAGGALGFQRLPWTRYDFIPKTLPYVAARAPRVGVGVEARSGPGLSVGTTLAEYDLSLHERSLLPVSLRASWDLSRDARWAHRSIYVFATRHHRTFYYGPALPIPAPLLQNEFGVGAAHTSAAVTSWIEFRACVTDWPSLGPSVGMAIGLDLGGTYGIGRSQSEDWW